MAQIDRVDTAADEQRFPLTKQQEGLWIEWRLHPDNTSYNTCVKLRLKGELDVDRFRQALQDVVDFFSSLRVYFVEEHGVPYQHVRNKGQFTLEFEDVSVDGQNEETAEQRQQAEDFLARKLRTPVDLKQFPIVRAGLIRTTEDTHYFIGSVPHVISDGASAILFLESTSIAYNQGYKGLEEAYGAGQKDWADYFAEIDDKADAAHHTQAAEYWHENLKGANHTIDFSHGQQEAGNDKKTGKRVYFDLPPDLSQKLKDFSRAQRTTLFSTLVGAFGTLINRYYNVDEVLIGYPVNIRPAGYKYLFGFFVNIIPIRVDMTSNPTFAELVSRVSAARKADKKFQTFPALDIVREIRKTTPGFDGRVFNVSMAQTVSRLVNLRLDGIDSEPLEAEYNDVNDDLSLSYELLEDGRIGLWLEYRQSLFEQEFVEQMIGHMQTLLEQVVEHPDKTLDQFDVLAEQETQKLLQQFAYPDPATTEDVAPANVSTIHGLIEDRAGQDQETIALIHNDKPITYGQLNAKANRLAHTILDQGVKRGDRIALCLKRGPDMIISLLAVMKAGCAYVPIPANYPQERSAFILEDAGCKLLITQQDLQGDFESTECDTLIVDELNDTLEQATATNPDIDVTGDDAAYIIYTSGSTGRPKGVLLNHGNVVPRLTWLQSEIPLDSSDAVLQNTDYSFDVSVAEIYWPLTTGARLILADHERYKDPGYLIDLMNAHNVTTTCFVPSLLYSLLSVMKDKSLPSLKRILAAGEALPPTLAKNFHKHCPGDLYNIYGPTEAAIYASFKLCPRGHDWLSVPIGRPLADTTLYILDQNNRPVPNGVAGELHIGGAGVAQEYVNLPELTAERFIDDPFADDDEARLYKTGDLCRFKNDGDIEYLGRIDAQVKIRGFRIELAEIESVISGYDGIHDIAVIDFGADGAHKRLVAYYVADADIDIDALKAHVTSKLPAYMLPSLFIPIVEIPRVTSGKINRRALPNPERSIKKRDAYVAPEGALEKQLAGIWSNILKIPQDKIGRHDAFFDIGGDSLMAIQFVCEAEEAGIVLDTNALFEHTTIAAIAKSISEGSAVKTKVEVDQSAVSGTYPLLPRQAKFFDDNFKYPEHWNRFFFFGVEHDVEQEKLQQAFDRVLMHHDNLRIAFPLDENGNRQQQVKAELPDTTYVLTHDLSALNEEEQQLQIVNLCNAAHTSLDFEAPPLIRALYFKTGEQAGYLAVIMHHLLVDIVSSRLVFEDFLKSYEALRLGLDLPLAPKTSAIKDWAEFQIQDAQERDFSEALAYWANEKIAPKPSLPVDSSKQGDEQTAAVAKIILDEDTTQALLQDIPQATKAGIQDTLLCALQSAMQEWTGYNEMVVNICGHGRDGSETIDLSRTVGWVNTVFPVHLIGKDEKGEAALATTRKQIAVVPKRNGDYNLLRYSLKYPEITKHAGPELFFNYVSQLDALIPDGVAFQPLPEPDGIKGSHGENHICYKLYIEAGVIDRNLNIHITYSTNVFNAETVEHFAEIYRDHIMGLIDAVKTAEALTFA